MRNDNYFKRLDYHIQDVPTAPFSGIFFHTESKTAQYLSIEDFLKTCSAEQVAKIFNTEKSPREKNCGLGKRFTDEVQAKRNSGFYLKIEADNAAEYDKTESGNTQSGKDSGNLAGVTLRTDPK